MKKANGDQKIAVITSICLCLIVYSGGVFLGQKQDERAIWHYSGIVRVLGISVLDPWVLLQRLSVWESGASS